MPPIPRPHEQDYLIVKNIDPGTDWELVDVIKKPHTVVDEFNKPLYEEYEEIAEVWNTRDGFRIKWDGKYHLIRPGQRKLMPRYLAEHYASHLADFIMMRDGVKQKTEQLKKKLMKEITPSVYQFYEQDDFDSEGSRIFDEVERMNRREAGSDEFDEGRALDLGKVDYEPVMTLAGDPEAMLPPESEKPVDMPPANAQPKAPKASKSTPDDAKPERSELLAELDRRAIEVTGSETDEELVRKLKADM